MSPFLRLRFRGCANNLSQSGQKIKQTLAKRLACDVPDATRIERQFVQDIADTQADENL